MLRRHRGVVFKPLRILRQHLHAVRHFKIVDLHDGFVSTPVAQRVVVHLYKTVDVVNIAFGGFHPGNVVLIPFFQIAAAVVCCEQLQGLALRFVFGHAGCQFQPFDHLFDGAAVQAPGKPGLLLELAFGILHQAGIETKGNRVFTSSSFEFGIVGFDFLLGNAGAVKIDRRGSNHIHLGVLIDFFSVHFRIKHRHQHFFRQAMAYFLEHRFKPGAREGWNKLVVGVVVVNAVGEKHVFSVLHKLLPFSGFLVAFVIFDRSFQRLAHG